MPLPQLPREVWTCVAQHLRQAFPNPREVKERKEVRQVDLVSMMRTSKLFNNATAIPLYSLIICDDIAALYHNYKADGPVVPGILSKKELLRFAKALYLEYPIRNLSSYHQSHINTFDGRNKAHAGTGIFGGYGGISHHSAPARDARSRILSCATFFGAFEDGWTSNFGCTMNFLGRVGDVQRLLTRMFLAGKVKHFCQSGNFNPLCIHPAEMYDHDPTPQIGSTSSAPEHSPSADSSSAAGIAPSFPLHRSITLHIDLQTIKRTKYDVLFETSTSFPCMQVRWCFDCPRRARSTGTARTPFLDFPDKPPFAQLVFLSYVSSLSRRHDKRDDQPKTYPLLPITVDAYIPMTDATAVELLKGSKVQNPRGSSAKEKSVNKRREAVRHLESALQKELFHTDVEAKVLHSDDHLGIHYIADCPECPACGWGPSGQ